MKKLIAIVLLLVSPIAFGAGSTITGKVGFIHVMGNGLVYVDVRNPTVPRANVPACSKYALRFVYDGTTTVGQMMYKALFELRASGAAIVIAGTGACMPGGYEIVDYLGLYP